MSGTLGGDRLQEHGYAVKYQRKHQSNQSSDSQRGFEYGYEDEDFEYGTEEYYPEVQQQQPKQVKGRVQYGYSQNDYSNYREVDYQKPDQYGEDFRQKGYGRQNINQQPPQKLSRNQKKAMKAQKQEFQNYGEEIYSQDPAQMSRVVQQKRQQQPAPRQQQNYSQNYYQSNYQDYGYEVDQQYSYEQMSQQPKRGGKQMRGARQQQNYQEHPRPNQPYKQERKQEPESLTNSGIQYQAKYKVVSKQDFKNKQFHNNNKQANTDMTRKEGFKQAEPAPKFQSVQTSSQMNKASSNEFVPSTASAVPRMTTEVSEFKPQTKQVDQFSTPKKSDMNTTSQAFVPMVKQTSTSSNYSANATEFIPAQIMQPVNFIPQHPQYFIPPGYQQRMPAPQAQFYPYQQQQQLAQQHQFHPNQFGYQQRPPNMNQTYPTMFNPLIGHDIAEPNIWSPDNKATNW